MGQENTGTKEPDFNQGENSGHNLESVVLLLLLFLEVTEPITVSITTSQVCRLFCLGEFTGFSEQGKFGCFLEYPCEGRPCGPLSVHCFCTNTNKYSLKNCIVLHFFKVSEPFRGNMPHRGYSKKCCSSGSCTTHSVHIVQFVLVLQPRFRLPEHVIDLLLHPGLDLRVVCQDSDQRPKH